MQGHRIGYVRVSSFDQNPERQLEETEVSKVFTDKASGKDTQRPQLEALLSFVRERTAPVLHRAIRHDPSSAIGLRGRTTAPFAVAARLEGGGGARLPYGPDPGRGRAGAGGVQADAKARLRPRRRVQAGL